MRSIQIPSDGEEREIISRLKERYESITYQSENMLLETFNAAINVIKRSMEGTEEQKNARIQKRIYQLYQSQKNKSNGHENFFQKRQPDYSNENTTPVLQQIIIHGTDWWPLKKIIMSLKLKYQDFEVIKIDKSHTKITFSCIHDALDWLNNLAENKILKSQQNQESQLNKEQLKGWIKLKPYQFFPGIKHQRQARFATNQEKFQKNQQFGDFQIEQIKKQIAKQILQDYQAQQKYERIMEKKQIVEKQCRKRKKPRKNIHNKSYSAKNVHRSFDSQGNHPKSHRDRSRQKNSRYYRAYTNSQKKIISEQHLSPQIHPAQISYDFILNSNERSGQNVSFANEQKSQQVSENIQSQKSLQDVSFLQNFDKNLKLNEYEADNNIELQNPKKDNELLNLLEQIDKQSPLKKKPFSKNRKNKIDSNFSYAQYIKEQEKEQKNFIQL